MQPQPTQSDFNLGHETKGRSADVPISPEVSAYQAYKEQLEQDKIMRARFTDEAFALASMHNANLLGGDQPDPAYFDTINSSEVLVDQPKMETLNPEWIAIAASNIVAVRSRVLSQNDYGLGA